MLYPLCRDGRGSPLTCEREGGAGGAAPLRPQHRPALRCAALRSAPRRARRRSRWVSPGAAGASRRRTPRALRELLGRQRGRLGEPRGSPGTCGIPEYGVLGWISAVPGEGRNLPCLTHGRLKLLNHQSIKERGRLEVGGWEEGLLSSLLFGIKRFISVRNLNYV